MSEHLVTTKAAIRTCRCGALLLAGIAEGRQARVDLTPIADETALIQTGAWTYTVAHGELVHRDDHRRKSLAPVPILADHTCPPTTLF